jgi:hypothetical protein
MTTPAPDPEPTYLQIRERVFHLNPAELGLAASLVSQVVWGVAVEMGYEVGSATLVALADGTTSLHYSTGGGLLGRGDYAPLAEASKALVGEAQKHLHHMSAADELPLPEAGQVRFILLAYSGIYTTLAPAASLSSNTHLLAPLFKRAQQTLDQMRLLAEKKRK